MDGNSSFASKVPHFYIVISDKDISGGALQVLQQIRPSWTSENVEFKLLTDGITNKLVGCKPKDADSSETVLVRVYGNKTDLLIDRKAETRNILLLGEYGLAPPLYATFDNGLVYQFVPGCTLTDRTVCDSNIYTLIARKMAQLHKVSTYVSSNGHHNASENNNKPFIWDKIRSFLDLVPEVFSDSAKNDRYKRTIGDKSKILKEFLHLKNTLSDTDSPIVFCHNDLLLGNVIYTEKENRVTFIDFEYAALNYQAFDIGNHFAEFAGIGEVDYEKFPTREFQLKWLRIYLDEFKAGEFTETDLERLYVQVNKFVLVSHLFWGIWALIQAEHSYIDFNFLEYAAIRFNEYYKRKDQFLGLELPR